MALHLEYVSYHIGIGNKAEQIPDTCFTSLTTATLAALNSLEVIRNKALRLLTGAVKWTLLALMQVLTVNSPVKTEKKKKWS